MRLLGGIPILLGVGVLAASAAPAVPGTGWGSEMPGGGWIILDLALGPGSIDIESRADNVSRWLHMGLLLFAPDGTLLDYDFMTTADGDPNAGARVQTRAPHFHLEADSEAGVFSPDEGNSTAGSALVRSIPADGERDLERVLLVAWSSGRSEEWRFLATGDLAVRSANHGLDYVFLTEDDFVYRSEAYTRAAALGAHSFTEGTATLPVSHKFLGVYDVLGPEPISTGTQMMVRSEIESRQCPCSFFGDTAGPLTAQDYEISYSSGGIEAYNMGRVYLSGVDVPLPQFPLQ